MTTTWKKQLRKKILSQKAIIGIIGLGYVGAALAETISQKGFSVIGFEKVEEKIKQINDKENKNLIATKDTKLLETCDIIILCIQTPIYEDKTPNLTFLKMASQEVATYLRQGQLVMIESSINPGVTRNVVLPYLQKSHLQEGEEFFLAFSPERIDPGNREFSLDAIPKVVSGLEENSLELTELFYEKIFTTVVQVSSLETAEMVKIFENTFRLINISLVNEVKAYTESIGVDMWEVVKAASSKPFGFLAHYPSPGAGGHCIPVDPFYLYYDAKKRGIDLQLIQTAGVINDHQPYTVVESTLKIMQLQQLNNASESLQQVQQSTPLPLPSPLRVYSLHPQDTQDQTIGMKGGSTNHLEVKNKQYKILLIGISYKPNIDDLRESPALKIWELFEKLGHTVSYHDPYVPSARGVLSLPLSEAVLTDHDIYVIVTNHTNINYQHLAKSGKPIVDTRHAYPQHLPNIYYI